MKKKGLFKAIMIASGVFWLSSCQKEKMQRPEQTQQQDLAFAIKFDPSNPAGRSTNSRADNNARRNQHVNWDYITNAGNRFKGEAISNNGGIHGQARLVGENINIKFNTVCLTVEGKQAVIGAEIKEIIFAPPIPGIAVGNILYIWMEDNGDDDGPSDRHADVPYISLAEDGGPFCDDLSPGSGSWIPPAYPSSFIISGGKVRIR
jgi:hypothetical protein